MKKSRCLTKAQLEDLATFSPPYLTELKSLPRRYSNQVVSFYTDVFSSNAFKWIIL